MNGKLTVSGIATRIYWIKCCLQIHWMELCKCHRLSWLRVSDERIAEITSYIRSSIKVNILIRLIYIYLMQNDIFIISLLRQPWIHLDLTRKRKEFLPFHGCGAVEMLLHLEWKARRIKLETKSYIENAQAHFSLFRNVARGFFFAFIKHFRLDFVLVALVFGFVCVSVARWTMKWAKMEYYIVENVAPHMHSTTYGFSIKILPMQTNIYYKCSSSSC